MIEQHPFQPFIPDNASVLIIGSFPGKEQSQNIDTNDQWFYGAKRNQFWIILSAVYSVELKTVEEKKQLFANKGIGITDIFLRVRRIKNNNLDDNLDIIEYNDTAIKAILEMKNFTVIFFTSKFVEKQFLKLFPNTMNGECLPSPSPRYARMSILDKSNLYKNKLPK